MSLNNRLVKLESKLIKRLYQGRDIVIVGCGKGCSIKSDDDYCEHEQKQIDDWTAEHDGKEPDEIIRIIAVPGPGPR